MSRAKDNLEESSQKGEVGGWKCLSVLVTSAVGLRTSCHFKLSEAPTEALLMQQGLICFKKSLGMLFLSRNVTF